MNGTEMEGMEGTGNGRSLKWKEWKEGMEWINGIMPPSDFLKLSNLRCCGIRIGVRSHKELPDREKNRQIRKQSQMNFISIYEDDISDAGWNVSNSLVSCISKACFQPF